MPARKFLLLFHSIHDVLRAEKTLKQHAVRNELVPVPRELSSDCGMSIIVDGDIQSVTGLLAGSRTAGIYIFDGRSYIPATPAGTD